MVIQEYQISVMACLITVISNNRSKILLKYKQYSDMSDLIYQEVTHTCTQTNTTYMSDSFPEHAGTI